MLEQTITASMEKDEMNYTLRQHSLGQNKGRYDYLFNFIKRLTLPKSQQVGTDGRVLGEGLGCCKLGRFK
jgi:malate synthase